MKRIAVCTLLFSLGSTGTFAQALTDGEVQRIDKAAGKITLKHEEIRNLDMPPMTMVFAVKDPALLDKVKAGEKVRFAAEKDGRTYVVTAIEKAK
jgi:Cu/Ag efflux protein CusF